MASFEEALAAIDEYRVTLLDAQHNENQAKAWEFFSARGGMSAFATPLTNVHATGIGLRIRDGSLIENDFVIKVFVFDKQDLGNKTPAITGTDFHGVGIDVEYLPIQVALAKKKAKALASTTPGQHQQQQRPVVPGIQISPLGVPYFGTLGCIVRRNSEFFALSNNHILASLNRLPIGTQIVQPSGNAPNNVFATLIDFEPLRFTIPGSAAPRNRMDAAIASISDPNSVQLGVVFGLGRFTPQLVAPRPGMNVVKSGRTTGVTKGRIKAIGVQGITVNYGSLQNPIISVFDNCTLISNTTNTPFALPGDSGAIIFEQSSARPLGLLFAGDGTTTNANDLASICTRFNAIPA
ncbi:MAG: hypothetical protein NTV43_00935 [Methylococcales bacterium]|nr:hypothetical protein [Methylococcales bacterium]